MLRGKLESWLLIPTLALLCGACAIDEDDLAHWMAVKDGEKLLGAYLADPERPLVLRAVATNNLFQMGQTAQIVGVIKDATPNDRKAVLPYITQVILTKLNDPTRKDVQGTAARVALYLMEFTDELEGENAKGEPYGEALLRLSVDWCLDQLDQEAPQEQAKRCDRILLAAAVARPDFSVPRIVDYMRSATDLNRLLLVDAILSRLRDAAVERQQAAALLKTDLTTLQVDQAAGNIDSDDIRRAFGAATQDSLDPRQQFLDAKWLHHVVVGPVVQAAHPIGFFPPCRENDDRQRGSHPAHLLEDIETVAAGQHQVEQEQVDPAPGGQSESRPTVARLQRPVAGESQCVDNPPPDGRVVLDGQDSLPLHGVTLL